MLIFSSVKKIYLVLLLGTFVFAQEKAVPRTNGVLIDSLLYNVFDSVLVMACAEKEKAWSFQTAVQGAKKQVLQSVFYTFLAARGGNIRAQASRHLRVELFDVRIVYAEGSFWGGWNSEWSRMIRLRLRGSVTCSGGDSTLYPFDKTLTWQDTVRQSDVPSIEAGDYPFLKGRQTSYNVWSQWVEPALVTISLSAVVYLFFTIRS